MILAFFLVMLLLVSFAFSVYRNFVSIILVGPIVFAFAVKTPVQIATGMTSVGYFGYYSSLEESYATGLILFGTFWLGYLTSNTPKISIGNVQELNKPLFIWQHDSIIFIFSVLALFLLYGTDWFQGNRFGGTATIGGLARTLFSLLVFSYLMFCFRARRYVKKRASTEMIKLSTFLLFSFLIMNFAGLRGWAILGVMIIFFNQFIKARGWVKTLLIFSIFPLITLKRILSGEGLSLRIGAQGDFVEVIGVLTDLKRTGFELDFFSLFNYVIQALPLSARSSVQLFTSTEQILGHVVPNFMTSQMGFNVSTFHVLYFLFGFYCLPLLFGMGRLFSILITKTLNEKRALNSTLYLLSTMSILNLGGLKYVTVYILVLASIRATSRLSKGRTIQS